MRTGPGIRILSGNAKAYTHKHTSTPYGGGLFPPESSVRPGEADGWTHYGKAPEGSTLGSAIRRQVRQMGPMQSAASQDGKPRGEETEKQETIRNC